MLKERIKVRKLPPSDSNRIRCQSYVGDVRCIRQAEYAVSRFWETPHRKGVSFFYHCGDHLSVEEEAIVLNTEGFGESGG